MIDEVFHALRDGEWHKISDMQQQFNPRKLDLIIKLFADYGFFELKQDEIRLCESWLGFVKRMEEIEKET